MAREPDSRSAFRCVIPVECSAAKLKLGNKFTQVRVLDTSRVGFTTQLPKQLAAKVRPNKSCELHFAGERWEVEVESRYANEDGTTNVGFRRIQELTKIKSPGQSWLSYAPRISAQTDPTFLFFLMLLFLFACLSLPGVGDQLGTASKVRFGVHTMVDMAKGIFK